MWVIAPTASTVVFVLLSLMMMVMPTPIMMMMVVVIMPAPLSMHVPLRLARVFAFSACLLGLSILLTPTASSRVLMLFLLFSHHLVYDGFFCLLGHFVCHYELHSFLAYKAVHLFALFFHYLLDVDWFVAEPSKIISNQMQVIASLASDKDHTHLVGILAECSRLSMLAYITCEHDHQ